jgi:hypothetical protein
MNFTPGLAQYSAILYGEHGTIVREIDKSLQNEEIANGDKAELIGWRICQNRS